MGSRQQLHVAVVKALALEHPACRQHRVRQRDPVQPDPRLSHRIHPRMRGQPTPWPSVPARGGRRRRTAARRRAPSARPGRRPANARSVVARSCSLSSGVWMASSIASASRPASRAQAARTSRSAMSAAWVHWRRPTTRANSGRLRWRAAHVAQRIAPSALAGQSRRPVHRGQAVFAGAPPDLGHPRGPLGGQRPRAVAAPPEDGADQDGDERHRPPQHGFRALQGQVRVRGAEVEVDLWGGRRHRDEMVSGTRRL